jgi:hypothetical protein
MPSQCKGVVSTTFDFQRTDVEIFQLSVITQLNFVSYQQLTAENGLTYQYPFDLRNFEEAGAYPGWFTFNTLVGNRENTMEFEAYFRTHARQAIEPWLEVVYWKIYSQPPPWRNIATRRIANHMAERAITSQSLWDACNQYLENPTLRNLNSFRGLLGLRTRSIALSLTYPSFLRPDLYPMVDTRIAKWVAHSMGSHNSIDPYGPQLTRPRFADGNQTVLSTSDFPFVKNWISWCRYTALKLTQLTSIEWRPRDVEMAVFNAWGGRHDQNPKIELEPLLAMPR